MFWIVLVDAGMRYLVAVLALIAGEAAAVWAIFAGTNVRIDNPWIFFGGIVIANVCAVVVKVCDD